MASDSLNDSRPSGDPRPPAHDSAPLMATEEARQGRTGNRVRYILGVGIVLVVVAFLVIYFAVPAPQV